MREISVCTSKQFAQITDNRWKGNWRVNMAAQVCYGVKRSRHTREVYGHSDKLRNV